MKCVAGAGSGHHTLGNEEVRETRHFWSDRQPRDRLDHRKGLRSSAVARIPEFAHDLFGSQDIVLVLLTTFALLLTDGRGRCDADAEDPGLWRLHMEYVLMALIGGVEYRLPGDGMISFSRIHPDPQPLPVGGNDEARHKNPVVFLIGSAVTLWANGDDTSASFLVIDSASRIVIEESIPTPAPGCLFGVVGVCNLVRPRRQRHGIAESDERSPRGFAKCSRPASIASSTR